MTNRLDDIDVKERKQWTNISKLNYRDADGEKGSVKEMSDEREVVKELRGDDCGRGRGRWLK